MRFHLSLSRILNWMSAVFEHVYHDIGSCIPLSFRFVIVRSIPFLFASWTEEWPVSKLQPSCLLLGPFRKSKKTFSGISFLGPIDIVEHRHEDDSIFKFFWTRLTSFHLVL